MTLKTKWVYEAIHEFTKAKLIGASWQKQTFLLTIQFNGKQNFKVFIKNAWDFKAWQMSRKFSWFSNFLVCVSLMKGLNILPWSQNYNQQCYHMYIYGSFHRRGNVINYLDGNLYDYLNSKCYEQIIWTREPLPLSSYIFPKSKTYLKTL